MQMQIERNVLGKLGTHIVFLVAAVFLSALLCGPIGLVIGGQKALKDVICGTGSAIPAVIFSVYFLFRFGTGTGSILVVTFVRVGLTTAVASYLAWRFSSLRTLGFFLAVTVVYLVTLFIETWLVWKEYQESGLPASKT